MLTHDELTRDLRVREPACQELQNFPFAVCQPFETGGWVGGAAATVAIVLGALVTVAGIAALVFDQMSL